MKCCKSEEYCSEVFNNILYPNSLYTASNLLFWADHMRCALSAIYLIILVIVPNQLHIGYLLYAPHLFNNSTIK